MDDITNQPSKFRTRYWVEIKDESWNNYENDNLKFKALVIKSNLCDYSDAYIHVKATVAVPNTEAIAAPINNTKKSNIY